MRTTLREAGTATAVALLQAPYPGRLKFDGQPSSLLHAIAVFARRVALHDNLSSLGWIDPGTPSEAYRRQLADLLRSPALRVLCISTTNAAIEEAIWAARLARSLRGNDLLVVVGGPHEDDCDERVATRATFVDLSIGGDAEFVLDFVLSRFLAWRNGKAAFLSWLAAALPEAVLLGGDVSV